MESLHEDSYSGSATRQTLARLRGPLVDYLNTETGSALFLLAGAAAALIWANVSGSTYDSVWTTELSIRLGDHVLALDLRHWVNDGLMAVFFFVVGLEARREFDLGELRDRHRVPLPALAALGGMTVPVAIYLALNAGSSSADGWGIAMSTDTAFALGALALVGPRSNRLRAFIVTVAVVDDLLALLVIGVAYTDQLKSTSLLIAVVLFGVVLVLRKLEVRRGLLYAALGVATWVAMHSSGVDPIIIGLAFGLITYAYPASREELERASTTFREFREQPTPELAATASRTLEMAISPNDRLARRFHPWSSYVIVPLFALANAGVVINSDLLSRAVSSPITWGIIIGYVVGKPLGIFGGTWLAERASRGYARSPVGWGALAGSGTAAGIGFTVSLLIASRAFSGEQLDEATLGVLVAGCAALIVSASIFKLIDGLPYKRRTRLLVGRSEVLVDLASDIDPDEDHIRGPADAPVTLVEYGDFECPYCGRAEPILRELLSEHGADIRFVFRHLPLTDVHDHAQLAAEAAEAAGAQGRFWEMHDLLLDHQDALTARDLMGYANELGLDMDEFHDDLKRHEHAARVARDVESAELSGVAGTPTFFINGQRHHGAYDIQTLTKAVSAARARLLVAA
ncbi:MAG TPA: Na+/H+ antiporter NhaA [Thermoleophilaceae bacterium]|nr:Na+/H+ antiporter NhaA [Thermoleophilaceae bacterium]